MSSETYKSSRGRNFILASLPVPSQDAPFVNRLWMAVLARCGSTGSLSVEESVFEELLKGMSRDCLNQRHRRRELAEALSPMVECGDDPGEACAKLISAALDYHQRQKTLNGGVCMLGKYHNLLHVVTKMAVDYDVRNNEVITRLLVALYSCEHTLERIVAGALLGSKVTHILSGWRSDYDDAAQSIHSLVFFLDHARSARLLFENPDPQGPPLRLLDVPLLSYNNAPAVFVAAQAGDPDVLQVLLQHGVSIPLGTQHCPFVNTLRRLSVHVQARLSVKPECFYHDLRKSSSPFPWLKEKDDLEDGQEEDPVREDLCTCDPNFSMDYPVGYVECLRLLFRVLGRREFPNDEDILHPQLVEDGYVSLAPPSLAHWCRLTVRERLHANWILPNGVYRLNLPESLITYLQLAAD